MHSDTLGSRCFYVGRVWAWLGTTRHDPLPTLNAI